MTTREGVRGDGAAAGRCSDAVDAAPEIARTGREGHGGEEHRTI
jgi:hypothetical protein